ncbi:MAG TPA: flagellar M-ring protein FliF, partial [Sphingomicrobium sp.]|nr:flagellar M-ring protein FliF [Sphingomicrobium sp.]
FATVEEGAPHFWDSAWFLPLVRQVGALVAAMLAFLFIGRPLMKALRRDTPKNEAADAAHEVTERSPQGLPTVTLDMIETAPSYEARADLVRNFVRQDREKAAMVVRQLVETKR